MKRLLLTIVIVVFASPVFGQEIDLGLGGDASSLLNIPAPRGNTPARGAAPAGRGGDARGAPPRGAAPNTPPVDRLVRLRELLAGANTPLSKDQETALTALINTEIPAMRRTLQTRVAELQRARADAPPPAAPPAAPLAPPAQGAGGQRGGPPANLPSMDELAPEIIRLNDQLLGKIAEAPVLNPEQHGLIQKLYKDQVKSRGGFDAIKLTMEDAAAPFSAEQVAQIQPLFDQQNQARAQLVREAQGQPDKAKLDQLQRDTLAKVLKLLNPAQRAALLTPSKPQK